MHGFFRWRSEICRSHLRRLQIVPSAHFALRGSLKIPGPTYGIGLLITSIFYMPPVVVNRTLHCSLDISSLVDSTSIGTDIIVYWNVIVFSFFYLQYLIFHLAVLGNNAFHHFSPSSGPASEGKLGSISSVNVTATFLPQVQPILVQPIIVDPSAKSQY